jgi:hypothetical protein
MSEEAITRQLVVFSLGDEEYALPIADVHEIIRYTEPRSVASSVDWVRGVISLRGKIVPVYDLASRLGCERARTSPSRRSSSSKPPPSWPASSSTTSPRSSRSTTSSSSASLGRRGRDRRHRQARRSPDRAAQPCRPVRHRRRVAA